MSAIAFSTRQEAARRRPENQLRRFVLIGLGTVTVDYALFYVLVYRTHISYLLAAGVSFIVASVCNYWLSVRWVFIPGKYRMGLEATLFFLTGLVGLLGNQASMWILVSLLHFQYLLAKTMAVAIVTGWNFFSKKKLVFVD